MTVAGHLHLPADLPPDGLLPGVVVVGPSPSVKEQIADRYAARLAAAGYVALTFDPRNLGESGGAPRQREDPAGELVDLRAGTSFLRARMRRSTPTMSPRSESAPGRATHYGSLRLTVG